MNKVVSALLNTNQNTELRLDLIDSRLDNVRPFYTVITGENGSYKSTILKKIAEIAITDEIDILKSPEVNFHIDELDKFKVIAYSGATIDRYPQKKAGRKKSAKSNCYTYLGQKAGSNIISRRQPFETMLSEAFSNKKITRLKAAFFKKAFRYANLHPGITFTLTSLPLNKICNGFESLYHLVKFSSTKSFKDPKRRGLIDGDLANYLLNEFRENEFYELQNEITRNFIINFSEHGIQQLSFKTMRMYKLGLLVDGLRIMQAEVTSLKTDEIFSLYDLSTGEFNMLNSILGLGFAAQDNAIVLIDEPEVSLHPQWQVEFMAVIREIFTAYGVSHVIVSTHSPLIVSSVTDNCLIIDLSRNGEYSEERKNLYGASTDEILINHFGLATGRNFFVMDTLQQAISLIEDDKENSPEFKQLIPELLKIRAALSETDPLIEVINTVISYAD